MSHADAEAPAPAVPAPGGEPDERDRPLLDYLIEQAWQGLLRRLRDAPKNDNR